MSPKKYLILAKIETTQFTDPVPTAPLNSMLVKNLTVTPLQVESEDRALLRPYFGNSEQIAVSTESRVEFDIEMQGSGTAGTAPKWGPLIRACGFAETLVAVTSAAYNPISAAFESVYIYCYLDGILGKLSGAMGNVQVRMAAKKLPHLHFSFIGKYVPVADASTPTTADFSGFQTPRPNIPLYTGALTVGAYAAKAAEVNLDMRNEVSHAVWMNNETLSITDRKPNGSIKVQGVTVATKNYWDNILQTTLQAFQVVHGVTAGNIVTIDAPKMQLVDDKLDEYSGERAFVFNTTFNPNAGNDEVIITCT